MAKKIYNINEMHKVLVIAHNMGNPKAINEELVAGAEVGVEYFVKWKTDVRALQETVWDYVSKKKNARFDDSITDDIIDAARMRIYPKWKTILESGEADKYAKELRVSERDVEDLVGFCWDFFDTSRGQGGIGFGTAEVQVTPVKFRKKVESLIGCAIAKNAVLSDEDRDTIDAYHKILKTIQRCIDTTAELKQSKDNFAKMLGDVKDEEQFTAFINHQITDIDKELTKLAETKLDAEQKEAQLAPKVKVIQNKQRWAK